MFSNSGFVFENGAGNGLRESVYVDGDMTEQTVKSDLNIRERNFSIEVGLKKKWSNATSFGGQV